LAAGRTARIQERFTPRKLKNVSMNRPETTNLNHQYINRRVFIGPALAACLCQLTNSAAADDGM
jgi:polyphosphate kinase 2 (PPK2 family)